MAEPLPDGITAEEVRRFQRVLARCWIVVGLLLEQPVEELDALAGRAEIDGPKFHQAIWRANARPIMEDREMLRAVATLKRDVLTTSLSLVDLVPLVDAAATKYRPRLEAAFRELFGRPDLREIPPLVALSALVRFIADRVPDHVPRPGGPNVQA